MGHIWKQSCAHHGLPPLRTGSDVIMGVDPLSPIAPVRLRALLLPVGKIKRSRFLSFAARLQAENVVRLGDVSPDARPNRSKIRFPELGIICYSTCHL